MSQRISAEKKARILSAVKDDGMGIVNAARKYAVAEKTIRTWLRKQTRNAHTSNTEVEKLRRENQALKQVIGEVVLSQKLKRKSNLLVS